MKRIGDKESTWNISGLLFTSSRLMSPDINPIQDELFRGCSWMWGAFLLPPPPPPLRKIRHTNPTMMKLGTVIPYLRKIQKMYKSRDTPLGFCWHQHFFTGDYQILLHQEIYIGFWCIISIFFKLFLSH